MSRAPKDGRIFESGVVKPGDIAAALGLGGSEPEVKPTQKLTPQQSRRVAEGKPPGPGAPGFEQVTVKGGRDAYDALGAPDLNSSDIGKVDGRKVNSPPPPRTQPQKTNWDAADVALNGPTPEESAAERERDRAEQAAALAAAAREGKKVLARAQASGTANNDVIKAGMTLTERIAAGVRRLQES